MRAFGRDHSHRADKLPLSRLQGPRRTRLRDQRAEEVAPGLVRARRSARLGQRPSSCAAIHLSAWKWPSANFAVTAFSEVRHLQANAQTTRKRVHLGNVSSVPSIIN